MQPPSPLRHLRRRFFFFCTYYRMALRISNLILINGHPSVLIFFLKSDAERAIIKIRSRKKKLYRLFTDLYGLFRGKPKRLASVVRSLISRCVPIINAFFEEVRHIPANFGLQPIRHRREGENRSSPAARRCGDTATVISSRNANANRRKMNGSISHMRPIKSRRPSPVFSPRYFYCRATRWIGGRRRPCPTSSATPTRVAPRGRRPSRLCAQPAGVESHSRQASAINSRAAIIDLSYSHALPLAGRR